MTVDVNFDPKNFSLAKSMQPMQGIQPIGGAAPRPTGMDISFNPSQGDMSLAGANMMTGDTGLNGEGFNWGGAMKGFSDFGSGVTSLAGLYNSYKQLGMMEDQLNFARADRNQNVANQAAITNERLQNQRDAAAQLSGHKRGTQEYKDYMAGGAQVSGAAI